MMSSLKFIWHDIYGSNSLSNPLIIFTEKIKRKREEEKNFVQVNGCIEFWETELNHWTVLANL